MDERTISTLYSDGTWDLRQENDGRRSYWLRHMCRVNVMVEASDWNVKVRHTKFIDEPCSDCGSVCPVPLQGLYKMMRYV